jgi:hypothetical protein
MNDLKAKYLSKDPLQELKRYLTLTISKYGPLKGELA